MEGGMDPVGPFANPLAAVLVLLVLPAIVGFAIYLGVKAYRNRTEAIIRARLRRAYLCFLVWGAFLIIVEAVWLITAEPSFDEQQGWLSLVGIFGGPPVAIVFVIGMFHAFMVWRVTLIKLLLFPTIAMLGLFFANEILSTDFPPSPWSEALAVCYALLVIVVSVRGLLGLRTTAKS